MGIIEALDVVVHLLEAVAGCGGMVGSLVSGCGTCIGALIGK
jgi:hypothetical protein